MRIMFISPHCLLDSSSGAALSMTTQLECLAKRGWECRALTGTVFDNRERQDLARKFELWSASRIGMFGGLPVMGVRCNAVEYVMLPFSETRRHFINAYDEFLFYSIVRKQLEDWKPDVVYMYGGWLLERSILRVAKDMGITTAFYLANNSYEDPTGFVDVDFTFVLSDFQVELNRKKLGIEPIAIGVFKDTSSVIAERTYPEMVTFINPSPEKGVTMFLQIARLALGRIPELRFLVVESRTRAEQVARMFGIDWNDYPNVTFLPQQEDMRTVYGRTKVLLFPSYCEEGGAIVLFEAQANSIPVLSFDNGPVKEVMAGGGFLFDIPERCRKNFREFPEESEVAPWLECLERLAHDPDFFAEAESRARVAAFGHDIERLADSLDTILRNRVIEKGDIMSKNGSSLNTEQRRD